MENYFITGATGLIGQTLIKQLLENDNTFIYAFIRNEQKAKILFANEWDNPRLQFIIGDIRKPLNIPYNIDYIVHMASITSSKMFIEKPVETIDTSISSLKNVLQLAANKHIHSMVFLSTMEVYGTPQTDEKIDETHPCIVDPLSVRDSYPISKVLCENLCVSYAKEYGIPIKIARLTQTFGQGVQKDDGRVFAYFARCLLQGEDIVLKTTGKTKRSYLHVSDASRAIQTILKKGENGEAYNVANEATYCTIREMAEQVAAMSNGKIRVRIELDDIKKYGFASELHMNLDTTKLQDLGWHAQYDVKDMFKSLLKTWK